MYGLTAEDANNLVKYIYTGSASLTKEQFENFKSIANTFGVPVSIDYENCHVQQSDNLQKEYQASGSQVSEKQSSKNPKAPVKTMRNIVTSTKKCNNITKTSNAPASSKSSSSKNETKDVKICNRSSVRTLREKPKVDYSSKRNSFGVNKNFSKYCCMEFEEIREHKKKCRTSLIRETKPHQCKLCLKYFKNKSTLYNHKLKYCFVNIEPIVKIKMVNAKIKLD